MLSRVYATRSVSSLSVLKSSAIGDLLFLFLVSISESMAYLGVFVYSIELEKKIRDKTPECDARVTNLC